MPTRSTSGNPFAHLRFKTRRTVRHHHDQNGDFLRHVREIKKLIPARFDFVLYEGSASWLGSEGDRARYFGQAHDDLTIFKANFHGPGETFVFGVRELFALGFVNLARLQVWDRRFYVLPHARANAVFIGFPVRNDSCSLGLVQRVVQAIQHELAGTTYPASTSP
ncbi:MAG: hypothetical protein ABSG86_04365 [Thermoguttaceae bacterium]|jgi:hypothetical protein